MPDSLMLSLLRLLCGLDLLTPQESTSLLGLSGRAEPTFGVAEAYDLISRVEDLKGTVLNEVCAT